MAALGKQLPEAVENLYKVFSRYPFRTLISAWDDHPVSYLALPLRELPADSIDRFVVCAMNSLGDVDDFRHYLPRALDLIAYQDCSVYGGLVGSKLSTANWIEWRSPEREAIAWFFESLWGHTLQCTPETRGSREPLSLIATSGTDIRPFLLAWQSQLGSRAAYQLWNLLGYSSNVRLLLDDKPMPWWEKHLENVRRLGEWLRSDSLYGDVEKAALESANPAITQVLEYCHNQLTNLR